MNTADDSVQVFSILGTEYSLKAPRGEEQALLDAARLLEQTLAATKRNHPTLIGDKLLVLSALNLCSQLGQAKASHAQWAEDCQARVDATLARLGEALAAGHPI